MGSPKFPGGGVEEEGQIYGTLSILSFIFALLCMHKYPYCTEEILKCCNQEFLLCTFMAIRVVEFSNGGYRIRNIFA